MILCGIGYAKYAVYQVDGDAVAFMDIADAIHTHRWSLVVNGYWNPAYAGALAMGQIVGHPSRSHELQTYVWVNFFIFVLCIAAMLYFVRSLLQVRRLLVPDTETLAALSEPALLLTALGLLLVSFQRELSLGAIRSDGLLLFFFLLAGAFLLRIQSGGRFVFYPLLGLALGLGYLTKSFALLPSGLLFVAIFLFGTTRKTPKRRTMVTGAVIAGVVFTAIAGPYILAISKQRGRPTTGESARLNYTFFVDEMPRWHEWRTGNLGHAKADFKHHEELIVNGPFVYSFAQHPLGTYPLWFDPSYWTDTVKPQFYLKGHIHRLERTTVLLLRFVTGHLEPFVLGGTLLLAGCFPGRSRRSWFPLVPIALWGLVMLGIYFPVDLQDRYLTPAFLFVVVPLLAMLRRPKNGYAGEVANGLALLFAGLVIANAVTELAERRRFESVTGNHRGYEGKEMYPAASGLVEMGIAPGMPAACFGDSACYVDHYWARIAGTPIRAEIEVPDGSDPGAYWNGVANHQQIIDALRVRNIKVIVAMFAPSAHIAEGWRQLGNSDFYAYPL